MTPDEALRILTIASIFDPTMLPAHDTDRVVAAQVWAAALPEVTVDDAEQAVLAHYRQPSPARLVPGVLVASLRSPTSNLPAYRPWGEVKAELDARVAQGDRWPRAVSD